MSDAPLKIIKFTAENFKRLGVVEITPVDPLVVIAGRNSQGKTSVLDAIWAALGGGAASKGTKKPIRDGEKNAEVKLDLGDLIVTRTWKGDSTTLTVTSADGAKYPSPQTVIDGFMGKLSFDPLEFTKLSSADQVAALLNLVDLPIDLDKLARERATLYEERTAIGRNVKSLKGQLEGLGTITEDVPGEEVSQSVLLAKFEDAQKEDMLRQKTVERLDEAKLRRDKLREDMAANDLFIREAEERLADQEPLDLEGLRDELANAEATNKAVRQNGYIKTISHQLKQAENEYDLNSDQITIIDGKKANALAEAKFPVAGLGFGDDGVTSNGIPFSQASSSEQIRVSIAMAMALSPQLRVIRILDGSLLDAENLAMISEMATTQGFQIWVERVGDGDGVGFVIEDGEVL